MIDFLAKIQRGNLIEDMYSNEYLFFKFHETFRSVPQQEENVGLRFDYRDGNLLHKQVQWLELSGIDGQKIKMVRQFPESHAEYTERLQEPLINNCSLSKISFDNSLQLIPPSPRLSELGNSAILIWDIDRFYSTIDATIESMGFEYSRGDVIYYDHRTYDGNLSYLHKDIEYQFQNEYRILIGPNPTRVDIKIPISGLKSMSVVVPTVSLSMLKIECVN